MNRLLLAGALLVGSFAAACGGGTTTTTPNSESRARTAGKFYECQLERHLRVFDERHG